MKSLPVPPHEMSYPPDNVTALSQPQASQGPHFRHLSRMARLSLYTLLIAALGGPSCLVTSSPDFQKPERTPPFLTNLSPPPYQIIPLRSLPGLPRAYPLQTITFEVVSEDLQSKPLQAVMLLDFGGFGVGDEPTRLWGTGNIPAGHINSPPRDPIKADIQLNSNVASPGCHSATLVVSHEFTDIGATKITPKDEKDVATATWWFDLDDDNSDMLTSCVGRGATTPDAGADGEAGSP
jgi:hypothetical protein